MRVKGDNYIPMELFQVTLKGFIVKDRKLLIVQPRSSSNMDLWDFPGGRIHRGEHFKSIEKTLYRELREELGSELRVKNEGPWIVYKLPFGRLKLLFPNAKQERFKGGIINIGYLCKYRGGRIRLGREHWQYRWVGDRDYKSYRFSAWHGQAIKEFFEKKMHLR